MDWLDQPRLDRRTDREVAQAAIRGWVGREDPFQRWRSFLSRTGWTQREAVNRTVNAYVALVCRGTLEPSQFFERLNGCWAHEVRYEEGLFCG